jgi:hypothetical protein
VRHGTSAHSFDQQHDKKEPANGTNWQKQSKGGAGAKTTGPVFILIIHYYYIVQQAFPCTVANMARAVQQEIMTSHSYLSSR